MVTPSFTCSVGSLLSTTDTPVGGPEMFYVHRDMDVPADALEIKWTEAVDVALEDPVELKLGYDGTEEVVFTGSVARLVRTLQGVVLIALSPVNALLNRRAAATYENQSVGGIAKDLVDKGGVEMDTVEDGPTLPHFAVDQRLTLYAHLKRMADRLGYELYTTREGKMRFHPLGDAAGLDAAGGIGGISSAISSTLAGGEQVAQYGQHLLSAFAQKHQAAWDAVFVGGESPMSSQGDTTSYWLTANDSDFSGEAGAGDRKILVLDAAARTKDLADRFAEGYLASAQRKAHTIQFQILGRPEAELGDPFSLSDVPDESMNQSGYIRGITHRFSASKGFRTSITLSVGGDG